MISRLRYYFMYALRNIQRGGRWTTLAVLCITAGVATVVALRSLGLAVGDTLINNVRIETKGDLLIRNDGFFASFGSNDPQAFSADQLDELLTWAQGKGARTAAFMVGRNIQISKADASQFGRPSFVGSTFIDPATYPPTHTIRALDPPDVALGDLFSGGNDVVISDNLAEQGDIAVGDLVRVTGTEERYTVRGIVSTAEESSVSNFLNAFFGFAYFDLGNASQVISQEFAPNRIGVVFTEPPGEAQMDALVAEIGAMAPDLRTDTTFELLSRYQDISQYLGDFVVVMGLGALLIGGVGIMNTMLVLVRRRTNEIAAVKTFGVHARQVAALFLTEGLLLGFFGSLLGLVVGIGLSVIVNEYGSVALRQPLTWKIYPEALLFGFTLGMVVSAIFGVAPILTAVRVRPNIILRPNESHLAALGIFQSIALLIFVTISLGLVVGHIVRPSFELTAARMTESPSENRSPFGPRGRAGRNDEAAAESEDVEFSVEARAENGEAEESAPLPSPYLVGVVGVALTFALFGLLIAALWLIVFLIGRLPSFGMVTLRLALRNLSTSRLRTATTLLALSAGMMALSSITFVGEGTRELLNFQLSRSFGGNVLVFPFPGLPQSMIESAIDGALSDIDLQYRTAITTYDAAIAGRGDGEQGVGSIDVSVWDSDKPDIYSGQGAPVAGRMLNLEDRGQARIVLPLEWATALDIQVGDPISLEIEEELELDFEVVGLIDSTTAFAGDSGPGALLPPDVIPGSLSPDFKIYSYQVPPAQLNQALTELSSIIFAFAIDVQFIDGLIARLIDQFAAIPTIVGLLSLFAAAVIMANTVALSTLERRRQIGILKAIGLKTRRVLRVMLIESSLVGLLSAVIGIGMSGLIISALGAAGGIAIPLPADARLVAAALLIASILIGWAATFLSARVAIKERVMNVLRYD